MPLKIIALLLLTVMFFIKEAKSVNDMICTDSLEVRQSLQSQERPVSFSYKNVRDYVFNNLRYPPQAIEEEIEGTVQIRFSLMKNGNVDSIEIITPVHPLLDAEAIRLIRNMPRWKPVYLNGQPVSLSYEVPVIFELLPPEMKQDSLK